MPNKDTLLMEPAQRLVMSYIKPNTETVDPFARDCKMAKWCNDLNPESSAEYHLDVLEFIKLLHNKNVLADLVIFDPPYSLEQMKRSYESINVPFELSDTWRQGRWTRERECINEIVKIGGIVISFGWNSIGMGVERYYKILEIKLLCHGGAHNDTIITVERKMAHQENMFGVF